LQTVPSGGDRISWIKATQFDAQRLIRLRRVKNEPGHRQPGRNVHHPLSRLARYAVERRAGQRHRHSGQVLLEHHRLESGRFDRAPQHAPERRRIVQCERAALDRLAELAISGQRPHDERAPGHQVVASRYRHLARVVRRVG
jgi:hypothetical protein